MFLKLLRDGGEPIVSVDLANGRRRVVPHSARAGGDPPVSLAVTGGYVAFYGGRRYANPVGVYAQNVERPAPPRLLGRTAYFLPSWTDGRVWFVSDASVREVTVPAGRTTVRGGRPPCRGPTLAALDGALVCQARTQLRAFEPATGRVIARLPGAFAAATWGRVVAWCGQACRRMHVTDVRVGRTVAIEPGAGFAFEASYEGAFSPGGSLLAVPALESREPLAPRRRVAVIDLRARRARLIAGAALDGYGQLAWSAAGRRLLFTAGPSRLMGWRPGADRAVRMPVDVRGTIMDLATSR